MATHVTNVIPHPDTEYLKPLDHSRIVLIANSSVAWSRDVCEYYCAARGIPTANIIDHAFGTGRSWITDSAEVDAFQAEIRTKCRSFRAQGIIMGPRVPIRAILNGIGSEGVAGPPLTNLFASAPWWPPPYGWDVAAAGEKGNVWRFNRGNGFYSWLSNYGNGSTRWLLGFSRIDYDGGTSLDFHGKTWTGQHVDGALFNLERYHVPGVTIDGGSVPHVTFPTKRWQKWLASKTHYSETYLRDVALSDYVNDPPRIPIGRLGYVGWQDGSNEVTAGQETEAKCIAIIDRATAAMANMTRTAAKAQPILFQFSTVGPFTPELPSAMRKLASQWGFATKYFWRETPSAASEKTSPIAGEAYSFASVQAGSVVSDPYYLMVGTQDNSEPDITPFVDAWRPVTHGGGVMLGASFGYVTAINQLHFGGIAGLSNDSHLSGNEIITEQIILYGLLCGMTWLEATFWGCTESHLVCGDPLWAPYGRQLGE